MARGVDVSLPAAGRRRCAALVMGWPCRIRLPFLLCRVDLVAAGLRRGDPDLGAAFPDRTHRSSDSGGAVFPRRGRHRRTGLWAALSVVGLLRSQRGAWLVSAARD